MSVFSRLTALEQAAAHAGDKLLTVHYTDGHIERMSGGDAVDLVFNGGDITGVLRFTGGPGNGRLPELLTDLLN